MSGREAMPMRVLGAALVVLGLLAVVFGGFAYTKEETKAQIGPLEVKVQEKERVNIPLWAGVAGIVAGAFVLWTTSRKPA